MSQIITQEQLEKQLDSARTDLKGLNENIKRIYGKQDSNFQNDKKRGSGQSGFDKRNDSKRERDFDLKRRSDKIFNRLGSKEDSDEPKKVSSRVISREHQPASRENAFAMQSRNDLERHKRMFGSLLGTLQKFKTEEDKGVQEKRARIDMKIEKQQLLVKEQIQQEKDTLISDRRRKQLEIKSLEIKMFKLKNFKSWEEHKMQLVNFIGTKATPQIYYLPKIMSSKSEALLKESQSDLQKIIEAKRHSVDEEIKEIETRLANDLQALEEGKLKKTHDEFENSEHHVYSDNENEELMKEASKVERNEEVYSNDRKRSFSPEKALRSQVVVKRANN